MELTVGQLFVIGIVASVATQALRLLAERFGFVPSRLVINAGLFVVSAGLAVGFFGLPVVGDDPVADLIRAAVSIAGSALLIYNILLDKVLMPPPSKLD